MYLKFIKLLHDIYFLTKTQKIDVNGQDIASQNHKEQQAFCYRSTHYPVIQQGKLSVILCMI